MLLLADVFFGDKRRGLAPTLTLVILVVGAFLTAQYANVTERVLLFSESYVADPLAVLLKLFGFTTIAVALLYSREYLERRGMMRGEYYVLALTALLGIFVMVSANSLLTVYIGVELLALSVVCHGRVRSHVRHRRRIGHEVLRAGRDRVGHVALWHVADLRPHRHAVAR